MEIRVNMFGVIQDDKYHCANYIQVAKPILAPIEFFRLLNRISLTDKGVIRRDFY